MKHPESTYRLRQNLPKTERLCSEKIIARLFQSGVFVSKYPLRLNAIVDGADIAITDTGATLDKLPPIAHDSVVLEHPREIENDLGDKINLFSGAEEHDIEIHRIGDVSGSQQEIGVKVLFSASKRRFPRAVDRNKIKRLLREVYRKNKQELRLWAESNQKQLSIAMIYTGKEIVDYRQIEQLWKDLQARLIKKLSLPEAETPTKSST